MKNWLYGFGLTFLLIGLLIWMIRPVALFLIILGAFLISVSKKSLMTKILSIVIPILILYLMVTSYY